MKHHNQFIRCIENVEDLSGQELYEYALLLAGGAGYSRKTIKYYEASDNFEVKSHSDDTTEIFSAINFRKHFNNAMDKRSLIALIK